jgi:hypothetical protein
MSSGSNKQPYVPVGPGPVIPSFPVGPGPVIPPFPVGPGPVIPPVPIGPGPVIPPAPPGPNINPLGPGGTQQVFDFSYSNLALMIGGQVLLIIILLIIVFFGTAPLSFPASAVRNMISRNSVK